MLGEPEDEISIGRTFWFTKTSGGRIFSQLGIVFNSADDLGYTTLFWDNPIFLDEITTTTGSKSTKSSVPATSTATITGSSSQPRSASSRPFQTATVTKAVEAGATAASMAETSSPTAGGSGSGSGLSSGAIAGIIIGGIAFMALVAVICLLFRRIQQLQAVSRLDGRYRHRPPQESSGFFSSIIGVFRKQPEPRMPPELPDPQKVVYFTSELPTEPPNRRGKQAQLVNPYRS